MARCDLNIQFDKTDRTYLPGETITGEVFIQVNKDTTCSGVIAEHYWRTHGRGNTDAGTRVTTVLDEGVWRAGEQYRYPFSFQAADGPPTFHGTNVNIDHYIEIRVDVPWAFDPTHREEYLLLPGKKPYGHAPKIDAPADVQAKFKGWTSIPFIVIAIVLVFTPLFFCAIPLLLIAGFMLLRNAMAEKKIGKVKLHWKGTTVSPNETVDFELDFIPKATSNINGITAKLIGQEKCVSGSGTKRTTHTHSLYERTVILLQSGDVKAGVPVKLSGRVPVPDTTAFSFEAPDNKIIWYMEIRVDIPMWPDWTQNQVLLMRPSTNRPQHLSHKSSSPPVRAEAPSRPDIIPAAKEIPPEKSLPQPAQQQSIPLKPNPEPTHPPTTDSAFSRLLGDLAKFTGFSSDRDALLQPRRSENFTVAVAIERIERTFGYSEDESHRNGRTIIGSVAGTEHEVSLKCLTTNNDFIDSKNPGDSVAIVCRIDNWDGLYSRLNLVESAR